MTRQKTLVAVCCFCFAFAFALFFNQASASVEPNCCSIACKLGQVVTHDWGTMELVTGDVPEWVCVQDPSTYCATLLPGCRDINP
jgi:hypothetical protein